jgi:hypothetical protein
MLDGTPPPSAFGTALGYIKTIAEIFGIIVGGLWAYYKFFKGRTFRPRLELSVSGKTFRSEKLTHLMATGQIKNVGLSKLGLSQKGTALRILSKEPIQSKAAPAIVEWKHLVTLTIFENHQWIEPGETIADELLLVLGNAGYHKVVKVELRIVAGGIEWNSLAIIDTEDEPAKP